MTREQFIKQLTEWYQDDKARIAELLEEAEKLTPPAYDLFLIPPYDVD